MDSENSRNPTIASFQSRCFCAGAENGGEAGPNPKEPQHPASYIDVLEMLERGETPPGIRVSATVRPATSPGVNTVS